MGNYMIIICLLSKNPVHKLPFLVAAGVGVSALELGDIGLPFRLTREGGKARHIALPVEAIDRIANHEEAAAFSIYLHIEDAHRPLALDHLGPHMRVRLDISLNHRLVVHERKRLTISFHRN